MLQVLVAKSPVCHVMLTANILLKKKDFYKCVRALINLIGNIM